MTRIMVIALVVLALFGGGFFFGQRYADGQCAKKELETAQAAKEKFDKKEAELNDISDQLEKERNAREENTKVIYQEVEKIVDRPIYRNSCFDSDGLRNANSALLRKSPNPGKPDAAMPNANPAH